MGDHRLTRIKLLVAYCIVAYCIEPLLWTDNSYNDTNNYGAYCIFRSISTGTSTWRVCIFCLCNSMDTRGTIPWDWNDTIRTYTSSRESWAEYLCRSEKMAVAIKYLQYYLGVISICMGTGTYVYLKSIWALIFVGYLYLMVILPRIL